MRIHGIYNESMIKIKCPCGRRVTATPNQAGRKKYCSKKCFYKYRVRPRGLTYKIVAVNKGWYKKGDHPSKETEFKKGNSPLHPIKRGQRISPATEFNSYNSKEEKNYKWKGDGVGYGALHGWVHRRLGKAKDCKRCFGESKRYIWHNISGEYKRDLSDWIQLCKLC